MHSNTRLSPPALLAGLALVASTLGCNHHYRGKASFTVNETFVQVSTQAELEPNDESASPHFLGVLRHGEMMTVTGNARAGDPATDPFADEFDGFAISLAEPTEIEFRLSFTDVNGELDVWVYDPAIDDIALFFETDFSPESGFFYVDAPVLDFHIIVRAFSGQANYTLDIYARPIPLFASSSDAAGPTSSAAQGSGVRRSPEHSTGAELGSRSGTAELDEPRQRYLGREQVRPAEEEQTFQSGELMILGSNGELVSLPILTVGPGQRVALLE